MMKMTAMTITYSVEISVKRLQKILDLDNKANYCDNDPLYMRLMDIEGVVNVKYDGHFGPYIFVELECEHDNGLTWNWIENIIKEYVRGKR